MYLRFFAFFFDHLQRLMGINVLIAKHSSELPNLTQSDDAIVSMRLDPIVVVVYLTCGFLISI
jgi:hypothetical protein